MVNMFLDVNYKSFYVNLKIYTMFWIDYVQRFIGNKWLQILFTVWKFQYVGPHILHTKIWFFTHWNVILSKFSFSFFYIKKWNHLITIFNTITSIALKNGEVFHLNSIQLQNYTKYVNSSRRNTSGCKERWHVGTSTTASSRIWMPKKRLAPETPFAKLCTTAFSRG